ncbi:phosphopantetheine-binding protein [Endozoicomonas sp. GU-1]|uniref:acyl carrier protein n=1 Tax=Endozoicomonas sp. GU-1 TaxID=3009078 RepID=UPI0022B57340|nr:phosphopantetheine-binding protein [Endozoicomonas sp. GU-1]WBA81156.1 phosphopantetheine-binding protein [Endozoicomonas sp. GU-1]WBA88722.1 phosphopantetheine-binding protein [Endozoicomonas sp. GU-1]
MTKLEQMNAILADLLKLDTSEFNEQTELLGALPEFDSMAVVGLITAIEETFGIAVNDDDLDAELFETVGSVLSYVNAAGAIA